MINFDVMIEESALSPQNRKLFYNVAKSQAARDMIGAFYKLRAARS